MSTFFDIKYQTKAILKDILFNLRIKLFEFFLNLIPIKKNKILIRSHNGKSLGGNVKYIVKEILKQNLNYELVWVYNPKFSEGKEDFKNEKIRFINSNNIFSLLYETASAKIWLDDSSKISEFKLGIKKRKNQFYINTWHGSFGIKKIFFDVSKNFSTSKNYINLFSKEFESYCDVMLSNCDWENEVFKRAFRFKGKIKQIGHPKNDIFFEDKEFYKNKVFSKLKIEKNKKIAFYVPSFRNSLTKNYYNLDYEKIKNALSVRFGGEWVVVSKFHPTEIQNDDFKNYSSEIDATYYPDIQELLFVTDVLISDYSSCMFDFMTTKRPCFIFAVDISSYEKERGFYYPLNSTPFPIAKNNKEMQKNIMDFDYEKFKLESKLFLKERNILEDGLASKRSVEIIKKIIETNSID